MPKTNFDCDLRDFANRSLSANRFVRLIHAIINLTTGIMVGQANGRRQRIIIFLSN